MIIGLTGGIGSGKSEVSRRFEKLGIDVIDADLEARAVVDIGQPALLNIAKHFGEQILKSDGTLDRVQLREHIFKHPADKQWLEELLHPIIRTQITQQLAQIKSPYGILVSPLLLETDQHSLVDRVLVVDVDEQLQLSRAQQRDNNSRDQIERIMATQLSREARTLQADDIILNNGDIDELDHQVQTLHFKFLQLSAEQRPA